MPPPSWWCSPGPRSNSPPGWRSVPRIGEDPPARAPGGAQVVSPSSLCKCIHGEGRSISAKTGDARPLRWLRESSAKSIPEHSKIRKPIWRSCITKHRRKCIGWSLGRNHDTAQIGSRHRGGSTKTISPIRRDKVLSILNDNLFRSAACLVAIDLRCILHLTLVVRPLTGGTPRRYFRAYRKSIVSHTKSFYLQKTSADPRVAWLSRQGLLDNSPSRSSVAIDSHPSAVPSGTEVGVATTCGNRPLSGNLKTRSWQIWRTLESTSTAPASPATLSPASPAASNVDAIRRG